METSYLGAQAFAGADLLHGPLAMVDAAVPEIAVVTPGAGGRAVLPVLNALRARQADLLLVAEGDPAARDGDLTPRLPVHTQDVVDSLYPVLKIMPLQQLAHKLALCRGEDPDAPRGLSKVTETW